MDREAIEEAIEVLEDASADMLTETGDENYYAEAIAILRQALEEKQNTAVSPGKGTGFNYFRASATTVLRQPQEPVAWTSSLDFDDDDQEIIPAKDKGKLGTSNCDIPLYTAPPKQWVGLTDEDYKELSKIAFVEVIEKIERVLKEKNT